MSDASDAPCLSRFDGYPERMKARWPFNLCGLLGVVVALVSVQLLRPPRFRQNNDVAVSFLGYTNQSNTCMALFQVTNRTAAPLICLVGPRASEASRGGRPVFHDLHPA